MDPLKKLDELQLEVNSVISQMEASRIRTERESAKTRMETLKCEPVRISDLVHLKVVSAKGEALPPEDSLTDVFDGGYLSTSGHSARGGYSSNSGYSARGGGLSKKSELPSRLPAPGQPRTLGVSRPLTPPVPGSSLESNNLFLIGLKKSVQTLTEDLTASRLENDNLRAQVARLTEQLAAHGSLKQTAATLKRESLDRNRELAEARRDRDLAIAARERFSDELKATKDAYRALSAIIDKRHTGHIFSVSPSSVGTGRSKSPGLSSTMRLDASSLKLDTSTTKLNSSSVKMDASQVSWISTGSLRKTTESARAKRSQSAALITTDLMHELKRTAKEVDDHSPRLARTHEKPISKFSTKKKTSDSESDFDVDNFSGGEDSSSPRNEKNAKPKSAGKTFAELTLDKVGNVKASVREWKARPLIDVRKYFSGKPTKKGISMSPDIFRSFLSSSVSDMVSYVRKHPEVLSAGKVSGELPAEVTLESAKGEYAIVRWISDKHKVKVYKFKQFTLLDVRIFLNKEKPTPKGVSLQLDQYQKLVEWAEWERAVEKVDEA